MGLTSQVSLPHEHFPGQGQLLHFAAANGYPPGAYRAFIEQFTADHELIASLHRPLWNPPPALETFTSWDELGSDLESLVAQLPGPVVSIGHSMGTAAILMAAVQRPELFRSLVLVEPVLVPRRYLAALALLRRLAPRKIPLVRKTLSRLDRFSSPQEAFEHYRPKPVFAAISDAVLWDYVEHGTTEIEPGVFALRYAREWEARCYTLVHNLWRLLPRLSVPTLAIRAQNSSTLTRASWNRWKRLSSQVEFVEVDGAGHLLPFEQPERLAAIIRDWLARNDSNHAS